MSDTKLNNAKIFGNNNNNNNNNNNIIKKDSFNKTRGLKIMENIFVILLQ